MIKNKSWKDKWMNNNSWPASQFAKRVFIFIKNKKLRTILDLGCGGGRDSQYFSKKGFNVVAVDVSVSKQQQEKLKNNDIRFIKSDIRNLKIKKDSFDIIYAHLSLHYFNDKTTINILDNLYKILRPGGYIFIKCKSIDDPLFGKGNRIEENFYVFGHRRHFFSKEYMLERLKDFKIIKISKSNSFKHPGEASFIEAFARK
jgi:SAM-dependent methyltransferase